MMVPMLGASSSEQRFGWAGVLRVTISLFRPIVSIPLALTGVSSRLAGNVSLDWHPNCKITNGCLFMPFFICTLVHHPLPKTYYLQDRSTSLKTTHISLLRGDQLNKP